LIKEANVTVMVADMRKSIRFYTETLGLELKANYGDQYAQISAPGLTIGLHPANPDTSGPHTDRISIGFAVENLDASMSELRGKGVEFSRVVDDRPTKLAFFTDSDGNQLYLSQTNQWSQQEHSS
jgi:catechol 2,3-dioxygenase-like lactoylglutathione lyase family enzyme